MKIAFFAHVLRSAGGLTVASNFLSALSRLRTEHQFLISIPAAEHYETLCARLPNATIIRFAGGDYFQRFLFEQFRLKKMLRRERPDAILSLASLGYIRPPFPQAVFLQQPHMVYPSRYYGPVGIGGRAQIELSKRYFDLQYARTKIIFCQSEIIRRRLDEKYGANGKHLVCGAAVSPHFFTVQADGGCPADLKEYQRRFKLIYVCRYYPHKNIELLVECVKRHRAELANVVIFLTIDPGDHPRAAKMLRTLRRDRLDAIIVNLGRIPHERIADYYRHCDASLIPSLLETVGLPFLEAAAVKLPLLCSDLDFARHQCGEYACYFDPWNAESLLGGIVKLRDDADYRKALAEGMQRRMTAAYRSWDEITIDIIRNLEMMASANRG